MVLLHLRVHWVTVCSTWLHPGIIIQSATMLCCATSFWKFKHFKDSMETKQNLSPVFYYLNICCTLGMSSFMVLHILPQRRENQSKHSKRPRRFSWNLTDYNLIIQTSAFVNSIKNIQSSFDECMGFLHRVCNRLALFAVTLLRLFMLKKQP